LKVAVCFSKLPVLIFKTAVVVMTTAVYLSKK